MNDIAGFEFPLQFAGADIDGIEIAVAAAEINRALRDDRARQKDIERIGDRLVFGWKP